MVQAVKNNNILNFIFKTKKEKKKEIDRFYCLLLGRASTDVQILLQTSSRRQFFYVKRKSSMMNRSIGSFRVTPLLCHTVGAEAHEIIMNKSKISILTHCDTLEQGKKELT